MPLDAATGPISLPEQYLADQLAACAACRTFLGAADAAAALARIHFDSLPAPKAGNEFELKELSEHRPFIVICTNPREGWSYNRTAFQTFPESGSLIVEFERSVPAGKERALNETFRTFKNELGAIAKEAADLAQDAGYLDITRIVMLTLWQSDPELASNLGHFVYAMWRVDWGVRG